MRVIQLKVENVKNIKAIEITPSPDGGPVILQGKNGAGKSAVTEALFMALTGKKIDQPIRNGQKKATVKVDLGEYVVKWVCTHNSSRVEVWGKEGTIYRNPRALLDKVVGDLTFDPTKLMTEKPAAQREIFMKLGGLDFTEIDKKRQELFDQRTFVNRQVRDMEGILKGMIPGPADLPEEEISITAVVEVLKTLQTQCDKWNNWSNSAEKQETAMHTLVRESNSAIKQHETDLRGLVQRIEGLQQQLEISKVACENLKEECDREMAEEENTMQALQQEQPEKPSNERIVTAEANIKEAEQTNIQIRAAQSYRDQKLILAKYTAKSEELTKTIDLCDVEKQGQIAAAKFPIEGLSVDNENALYYGKSLSQLSKGEKIMVGTAIGMALNPKLRILRVEDGSLLDDESKAALEEQALNNDYQLWEEMTGEKGVGILIEDGSIKRTLNLC